MHEMSAREKARKVSKTPFIFYHSCGYIEPIIPGLIDTGFDILNPMQPEAKDPVKIKNNLEKVYYT